MTQASAAQVFDTAPDTQLVCVVSAAGAVVDANRRFRSLDGSVAEAVVRRIVEHLRNAPATDGDAVPQSLTIPLDAERSFEAVLTPRRDGRGQLDGAYVVLIDAAAARRFQERLDAVNRAGQALVEIDMEGAAAADWGERLSALEAKVIADARKLLHFDHFVVRVLDTNTRRLDTILALDVDEEVQNRQVYASDEGNGVTGFVAATGRSFICPDVRQEARYVRGLSGARSSLTVPLMLNDDVFGVMNVESDKLAAFDDEDRRLAEAFGRYVALALHVLRLLGIERRETMTRMAHDLEEDLGGLLEEIITQASNLLGAFDSPTPQRSALAQLRKSAEKMRGLLDEYTDPPPIGGFDVTPIDRDPVLGGKHVLIVDDEDIIRETIADVLTRFGAVTVTASDGQQANALLSESRFDLVLSDIKMPHSNGYEVFASARKNNPTCPVILMTGFGYDPNHSIVRASKEGLSGVLFKPFKVDQLVEDVRRAFGAPTGA